MSLSRSRRNLLVLRQITPMARISRTGQRSREPGKRKSKSLRPCDMSINARKSASTDLSLFACARGHLEQPYIRPGSNWRECVMCRRDRRREARRLDARCHGSLKAASEARHGRRRKPLSPHKRHLATMRQRKHRAKLASGGQVNEPLD